MNTIVEAGTTVALAVVGLGIVSVLVSRKADTVDVIHSAASGLANNIAVAQSPVTGAQVPINTSYPSSFGYGFGQ